MKESRLKTSVLVYLLPLIAGLISRIFLFQNWLDSPLRYYHLIQGLDMKTMLELGSRFYHLDTNFSIYRLLIASVMFFNHGAHCVEALIIIQMLFGSLTGVLIAYISLRISGNRYISMFCGILAALYSPALLYECLTLQESTFLFFNILSIAVILKARTKHFSALWLIFSGIALFLPPLMRFSSFLWALLGLLWIILYMLRRVRIRNTTGILKEMFPVFLFLFIGIAAVVLPVSLFNLYKGWDLMPFSPANLKYTLQLGSMENPSNLNLPPSTETEKQHELAISFKNIFKQAANYSKKALFIFRAFEIPNNVNYYFIRSHLNPLEYLPGPLLLIPAAVCGIIIMLAKRRFMRRESILFFYLISFTIPLCIFFPLGRYRIVFLPVFCLFAGYFLMHIIREFKKVSRGGKFTVFLIPLLLYALIFRWAAPSNLPLRAEDFVTYGQALEIQKGDVPEVETCFALALLANPESKSAALNLTDKLIRHAKFEKARSIIEPFYFQDMQNYKFAIKYAASLLGIGKAEEAEEILRQLPPPENKVSRYNYFFNLAESRRLQRKDAEAAEAYKKAMELTDRKENLEILKEFLKKVNKPDTMR
ncbi:MAG: hypothetical protein A2017_07680 [Lentisphaerae bacterium GWF2_44_16]|nr:MAG: hypothetical protein A2017_07680 [Lentisphaerae bacterium GWF2_44_16]